jgi:hypothetical protein
MNLLSHEDIDEGGAVFALLALATGAWMVVYSVSLVLGVHWLVALPITLVVGGGVRNLLAAIGRGANRWSDAYDERHPERNRPPEPDGHRYAKSMERFFTRYGEKGLEAWEEMGGYEGVKARAEAEMQARLDEWLAEHPPPPPPVPWYQSTVDAIAEKNRARRAGADEQRRRGRSTT